MQGRVWIEIDHEAIAANVAALRRVLGPGCEILGVVKADAYGHGLAEASRSLAAAGVTRLGVANAEEGIALREAGLRLPILVLGPLLEDELEPALRARLTPTVHDFEGLDALCAAAHSLGVRTPVHLFVETGMGRFGCRTASAAALASVIARSAALWLEGVATHLACADATDPGFTETQLERFERTRLALAHRGLRPRLVHAAASAAALRFPSSRFNLCRPGLALYGIDPGGAAARGIPLRPALQMRTRLLLVRHVPEGQSVGYGAHWRAQRPSRVGLAACGYHDGYPLTLGDGPARGGGSEALVRGLRARVIGRVSMDALALDLTDVPTARAGDVVTLIGTDGTERIGVEELARRAGTIPYELLCRMGPRVRRRHLRPAAQGGAPAAPPRAHAPRPPRPSAPTMAS